MIIGFIKFVAFVIIALICSAMTMLLSSLITVGLLGGNVGAGVSIGLGVWVLWRLLITYVRTIWGLR